MKYEKYKDSGVEWLGEVPEHWEVKRIKNISFGYKAGPFGSSLITSNLLDEGNILVYTPEHVANKSVDVFGNLYLPEERKAEMSQFIVSKDDIIFPIVGTLGRAMRITENMPNGIINQRLAKFKINDKEIDANYFLWLFGDSNFYEHYINLFQRGSIIVNLTKEIVGNMPIPLPPLSEQQDIANYLDAKCAKINGSIDVQKRKIELLNELKQTIITDAVTKGLNPHAPMKNSGVEWIGNVPEHWEVCKIKNVLKPCPDSIKIGPFGSSLTGKIGENLEYKVYGQWNIVGSDFNAGSNTIDAETFKILSKSYRVASGDILVSMMGTIGKCAIIPDNIQGGIMDSHVVKIRLNSSKITNKFFEYFYDKDKSNVIYSQLQKVKGGSIMDGLNSSIIKNLTIVTPPIEEQQSIVAHIESETSKIDAQIAKANRRIELLNELKQSIITEAVTGKIKVC